MGTSHRFRFVAKDAEKVDVDMSSESEEEEAGDEAEGFLKDLEADIKASRPDEDGSLDKDEDGKKRKRAEDFSQFPLNMCVRHGLMSQPLSMSTPRFRPIIHIHHVVHIPFGCI